MDQDNTEYLAQIWKLVVYLVVTSVIQSLSGIVNKYPNYVIACFHPSSFIKIINYSL